PPVSCLLSLYDSSLPAFPTRRSSDLIDASMAVNLHRILSGVAARSPHQHHQNLVNHLLAVEDISIVNRMALLIGQQLSLLLPGPDRKSTRLNSSHVSISYAVFFLYLI